MSEVPQRPIEPPISPMLLGATFCGLTCLSTLAVTDTATGGAVGDTPVVVAGIVTLVIFLSGVVVEVCYQRRLRRYWKARDAAEESAR